MHCPVCEHSKLIRTTHAGFNLFQCETCKGHLVESNRLRSLQHRVNKDLAELASAINTESRPSTKGEVWCPRCRNRMHKSLAKTHPEFEIDTCRNCDLNWLDGGELARYELDFEFHVQEVELNRMRERLSQMTDEEKEKYEAEIAALQSHGEPLTEGTKSGVVELAAYVAYRHLFGLHH